MKTLVDKFKNLVLNWDWFMTWCWVVFLIICTSVVLIFYSIINKKKIVGYYLEYTDNNYYIKQKTEWSEDSYFLKIKEKDHHKVLKFYNEFCKTHKCLPEKEKCYDNSSKK